MASLKRLIEQEKRLESRWMDRIGIYFSLTDGRKMSGGIPTYPSFEVKRDRKGNETSRTSVICRIQDFTKSDTWDKFCLDHGYNNADLIHLSSVEQLRDECVVWLRTFRDRYANLDGGGQVWMHGEALYGVAWRILENKWLGWWALEDKSNPPEDYWQDEHLRDLYGDGYLVRKGMIPTIGKMIKKMLQDGEKELSDAAIDAIARKVIDLSYLAKMRDEVHATEEAWQEKERSAVMKRQQGEIAI